MGSTKELSKGQAENMSFGNGLYDVIILATTRNIPVLKVSLPYIRTNLDANSIKIIANVRDKQEIESIGAVFIDETSIYEGMSLDSVMDIIKSICGETKRVGWYLQQFIKMSWCYKSTDSYYVVFDADTIPLHHINYISDNKYLLTQKMEYHKPYFDTIDRLFNGTVKRQIEGSFIAENMIIDTSIMKEMLDEISNNEDLRGNNFYEKILYAINPKDILGSGFSEFETYGNYIMSKYPDKVKIRKLKTLREAMQIISSSPSVKQLDWASRDYEIISIEASDYKKTFLTWLTKKVIIQKMFSMKTIASGRTKIRTLYRRLIHKDDMVFD